MKIKKECKKCNIKNNLKLIREEHGNDYYLCNNCYDNIYKYHDEYMKNFFNKLFGNKGE